jgi:hypothetical protein
LTNFVGWVAVVWVDEDREREHLLIEDEPLELLPEPTRPRGDDEADDDPLDVEVIEPEPITPDEPERGSDDDSAAPLSPFAPSTPPPPDGVMTLEAAVSAAAQMRRNATIRRGQRALPRGTS